MSLFGVFREPRLVIPALTDSARGQDCTLMVPNVCNGNPETTTWAHSNQDRHGKGKGLKSHDPFGAFACSACHDWYDRERHPDRHEVFERGRDRTLYRLFESKKLRVVS